MTDGNGSEWWRQHLSRRAALRAGIVGAAIPGILYLAKAADSAEAADDNVYIPGAPNYLELGHGWPGKEGNAGRISYRRWSDALDIVGAGTTAGYRKVKIWDDLYVQGLLNLRAYIVDPEVPRTWTAFLYAKDVNGQSKPFWKDATGTAQPLVSRSATLVVAAGNASPWSKLGADYVCDGIADEAEISSAINALSAAGGTVQLTEGTFSVAAAIVPKSKTSLVGAGMGKTVITQANNTNLTDIVEEGSATLTDVVIQDLTIDGNASNNTDVTAVAFGLANHARITLSRVEAKNTSDHSGQKATFHGDGITDYRVLDCRLDDTNCIRASQCTNVVVKGCMVNTSHGCGIIVGSSTRVSIVGNIIYNAGRGWGSQIDVGNSSEVIIADNVIEQSDRRSAGIWTQGPVRDVVIAGNAIYYCHKGVSWAYDSGAPSDIAISNNVMRDCEAGIAMYSGSDVVITGNTIADTVYEAIYTGADTSAPTRLNIGGNHIYNANTSATVCGAMELRDLTYSLIHGNSIDTVGDGRWAVREQNGDHNVYRGNRFLNIGASVAMLNIGASTVVRDNIGFVTENSGTATLANGTTSITVDHGLSVTPAAGDIMVTPVEVWGNMTKFWIGNYTSSQFTIYADQNPGQDVDFAWKAVVL